MQIRALTSEDYHRVRDFYYALIDAMKGAEYKPGWECDSYPSPACSGRGLAKQMVQKVMEMAGENHIRTIHLDVLKGNLPAERAYKSMGFV